MERLPTKAGASRLRGLVLLLGLTAFAMTGCLRFEMAISINDDGSGVFGTIVAISDVFTEATGASPEEGIPTDDLPPGAEVSEYREDGFTGIELAIPFANTAQLALPHERDGRGRRWSQRLHAGAQTTAAAGPSPCSPRWRRAR